MNSPSLVSRSVTGAVWSTVFYAVLNTVNEAVYGAVSGAVTNAAYWGVERAVAGVLASSLQDDVEYPGLQDFLLEIRKAAPLTQSKTLNEALEKKMLDATEGVVSKTVSRLVEDVSNRVVWRVVSSPVDWTVHGAVYHATKGDPAHPGLQDFLGEVGGT